MRTFRRLTFYALVAVLIVVSMAASASAGFRYGQSTPLMALDVWRLHEVEARPNIDTLQDITATATTDTEALDMIHTYYVSKRDYLSSFWQETNEQRLQSLYIMYTVHISHYYGHVPEPAATLLDYIRVQPRSHCGPYSVWQSVIATKFGLNWRRVGLANGDHGWVEVKIDDRWELFDSTMNVWIDRTAFALINGVERNYRTFWTPMNAVEDAIDHTYVYTPGYNMVQARALMPLLGLHWFPSSGLYIQQEAVTIPRYP